MAYMGIGIANSALVSDGSSNSFSSSPTMGGDFTVDGNLNLTSNGQIVIASNRCVYGINNGGSFNGNFYAGINAGPGTIGSGAFIVNNTAVGVNALGTPGPYTHNFLYNTALGYGAGGNMAAGIVNFFGGYNAGLNVGSGSPASGATANVAIGSDPTGPNGALQNLLTGSYNTAIGVGSAGAAGISYTGAETLNILIANTGVTGESQVTRIGSDQTTCYIAGIAGVTVASSAAVLINTSTGQLGTVVSSLRYKENVQDMADSSNAVMNLRPVNFNFKADKTKEKQYGLIAEEVNDIFPDLVLYNNEGMPESVKYHELPILLLNEIKKLAKRIEQLEKN